MTGLRQILAVSILLLFVCSLQAQQKMFRHEVKEFKRERQELKVERNGVKRAEVMTTARYFLGVKHEMGGTSHEGIDCSGLIYMSFKKHGIVVPRTAAQQSQCGKFVKSKGRLRFGDMIFFHTLAESDQLINHVGFYLGDKEFIHVSSSRGCVISRLDEEFWSYAFLFGARVW
ncbi:C40 family peptidase [Carboxylicivirga sp. M1479]|uniref:C40 family peptidase n=1 Tax=Carboxylicivirga sp. M1479 TaxID=2594476 RepID=UPI0011784800|nr:C40 family peptidase [Carboxylicivirga sp. M1479]TRX71193.1 NlpC/P60 family protein [Carboxylicivirga sp. M1479]